MSHLTLHRVKVADTERIQCGHELNRQKTKRATVHVVICDARPTARYQDKMNITARDIHSHCKIENVLIVTKRIDIAGAHPRFDLTWRSWRIKSTIELIIGLAKTATAWERKISTTLRADKRAAWIARRIKLVVRTWCDQSVRRINCQEKLKPHMHLIPCQAATLPRPDVY
jgi:hypothetical protein